MKLFRMYRDLLTKITPNLKRYFSGMLFSIFASASFSVLFGIYLKNMGYQEAVVGTVIALQTFGMAIGSLVGAVLSIRIGKKRSMIAGQFTMIVCGLLMVDVPILAVTYVASFFFGMGNSVVNVMGSPILYENLGDQDRVTGFSFNFVLFNLAFTLSSLVFGYTSQFVAGYLGDIGGNRVVLNLGLCSFLISSFMLSRLDEKPIERKEGRMELLSRTFANYATLLKGRLLVYTMQTSLTGFGAGLIIPFFPVYIKHVLQVPDGTVGSIMAFAQVGMIVGGLIVPVLAQRYGRVQTVVGCQLMSIPFLISITFPQSFWLIVFSLFFRSMLMNMAGPVINNLAMELVDDELRTFMSSMVSLMNSAFRALGIFVGGILMQHYSYNTPYFFTITAYLLGTSLLYLAFSDRGKEYLARISPRFRG
ncbi:MAG: MFS transporter [Bacillota bacterium]|nr:MFS transporter [Bacillota bacterium]